MEKVNYKHGFYNLENDGIRNFRWMQKEACVEYKDFNGCHSIVFEVGNPCDKPVILWVVGERKLKLTLVKGWQSIIIGIDEFDPNRRGG